VQPLTGRNGELLGALLIGSSRGDIVLLTRHIYEVGGDVWRARAFWIGRDCGYRTITRRIPLNCARPANL